MKELILFYMEKCPHSNRAREYMQELVQENPEYKKIPLRMIEERQQPEIADRYDYYLVPTYYLGEEKLAEGRIDKEGVRQVFERALHS